MISELALDVEVIAEARHGEEALELIQMSKPHIVVTDMNMPVMNGQQFLETLYTKYAEIKVIVISGYSQFEYLKAAVTYQACEYVLKPISMQDLKQAMIKAMEASLNYLSILQQKRLTKDMWNLRREVFLQNVTSRRITNQSDIQGQSVELQITEGIGSYRLAVCMFRGFHEISETKFHGNADLLIFSIENILSELIADTIQETAPLLFKSDDKLRLCVFIPEPVNDDRRIRLLFSTFHDAVYHMLKLDVVVGVSGAYANLEKLPEAFETAYEQLRNNTLHDSGLSINLPEQMSPTDSQSEMVSQFELKALQQAFVTRNGEESRKLLKGYAHKVSHMNSLTIREAHRSLGKIMEMAASEMKELALSYTQLFDTRSIIAIVDWKQFSAFIDQFALLLVDDLDTRKKASDSTKLIHEITSYLDKQYFEDVSLIDLATRFHLDPSYLSKQFKSVTGENFIEYLTRKRMEMACELLRLSERKITDISELVGYENQRYFSQVFKKFTGQTPSEYREHAEERAEQQNFEH
ncbi:helix-turn-helix domain-containing protein [Paenibacillus silvestris]|nr:helix-turn-helix domain-containing protein [Paenibacillus silvestris]